MDITLYSKTQFFFSQTTNCFSTTKSCRLILFKETTVYFENPYEIHKHMRGSAHCTVFEC